MARPFEARLLSANAVSAEVLTRALEHQRRTGLPLGDCLVTEGSISEEAFLKTIARDAKAPFVTAAKLSKAKVADEVLERIPIRMAERLSALPLALDRKTSVLTIACPDPDDEALADEVRTAAQVQHLVRVAALESSIQAGIKQHYYRDPHAFNEDGQPAVLSFRCTQCRAWLSVKDFQCPRCELLVNPAVRDVFREPSLVRALIAAPEANPGSGARLRVAPAPGTEVAVMVSSELVPRIIAGMDLAERPLHPFEAYVVSRTDGQLTVAELAAVCGMGVIEVQAVFGSLLERGVVELTDPRAKLPAAPEPAPKGAVLATGSQAQDALTQSILERAGQLERAGKVDEAITTLTEAIGRMARPAPLYNRLALVLLNQRDDALGAERILRLAAQLEPENPVIQQNLQRVVERLPGAS